MSHLIQTTSRFVGFKQAKKKIEFWNNSTIKIYDGVALKTVEPQATTQLL